MVPTNWRKGGPYQLAQPLQTGPYQLAGDTKVDIMTGDIIEGSLPRRAARLVAEWVAEHADELAACWESATSGEEPGTIEPLQ